MRMHVSLALFPLLLSGWLVPFTEAAEPRRVEFNRDIRPILSDRCFACHGPDEKKREADLRLDDRASAVADREGIAAIVPGKPEASVLLGRVTSSDADAVMPPADSNKTPVSKDEAELLRRWIAEGAEFQSHWSLLPMKRPTPPRVSESNEKRVVNEIDRFILDEIDRQGIGSLAPEGTREQYIRRVTFDLTGLPPTVEEIDAFLDDTSANAHEALVDRLLESPRFGERLATEWLDVARYADTHGYQMDRPREMWAYRDWVIRAFNANLPYDQFTRWQVAGDLLPKATKDQRLATAFNRLHCQNEEGGVVEEEFRVAYVVDRVTTFGTAFLGLTMECSRCHDHKYDPVTMKDFYSLFAFFQNIPESGQTTYWGGSMPTPTLLLSTDEQDVKLAKLDNAIGEKQAAVDQIAKSAAADYPDLRPTQVAAEKRPEGSRKAFEAWLLSKPTEPVVPGRVASYAFEELKDNHFANGVEGGKPANGVESPTVVEGKVGKGVQLTGDNGINFPGVGNFNRSTPFSAAIWIKQPKLSPRAVVFHHSRAPADAGSRGYDLLLEKGHVAFGLYHMFPGNCIKVRTKRQIKPDEWMHVVVSYDGSSHASGMTVYLDGIEQEVETIHDSLWKDITYSDGEPELAIGFRFRDNGFTNGSVDEFQIFDRELSALEASHLAGKSDLSDLLHAEPAKLAEDDRSKLLEYFLATAHEPMQEAKKQLQAARDAQRTFINPIPEAMVMSELPEPKPAFILARGNYDQPTTPVSADVPATLPELPKSAPPNRAGLADWLLDSEHPLMARVTVNRYWQMMFGRGLVETSDNFGSQGATPTHPELLDWLARDFIAHGWDVKRLLKQMALSATYRQDSKGSPESFTRDADNRWLARAPVRRLSAEMLRDQALFASGLLVEKMGGPPVFPYQPDGLWTIAMGNPQYGQSHGEDLYRRSLYSFWKRTVPPPAMMTFDSADRSYCTVRRQSTSTPLQALVLLNDPQYVEAARKAAERMLTREDGMHEVHTLQDADSKTPRDAPSTDEKPTRDVSLAWLFRSICTRSPSERELKTLTAMFDEQRALFEGDPESAKKLLGVGESKKKDGINEVDLAAGTVVALAIFNHDEAIHRR